MPKKPRKNENPLVLVEDDDSGGQQGVASGQLGSYGDIWGQPYGEPGFPTMPPEQDSFLLAETKAMENERRLQEQRGHRKLASVNTRERSNEEDLSAGNELGMGQDGPKEHPFLQSQRFDGVDPNVSPAPDIGTEARREFDNERREQEKEKQLRLGLDNKLENRNEYRNDNIPDMKPR